MHKMAKESYCPSHNCNVMQLLPIFMDNKTNEEISISPSQLRYELQMSCEERLERLCKPTRKYRMSTEVNTFSRTPDIIVFQNFNPGMSYTTTLSLLNLHRVSRHLRVVMPSSPFFRIKHSAGDCSAKVAPGMSYVLNITFLPLENRDCIHNLTIVTDGETFNIPLYGLGHRQLLNLPDHINLPPTAVKLTSEKSIILHNCDKTTLSYVISSADPFGTYPCKDSLKPDTLAEIKVLCKPLSLGLMQGCLYFCYGDIKIKITVECEVKNANIYLEKDCITFEDIFMGLKKQDTITIYNRSNLLVDFQWKLHKSYAIDKLESANVIRTIEGIKELEKKRCNKLEKMNIIDYEGHSNICDRTFEDEVSELEMKHSYLYENPIFDIMPLTGQVLPNQSLTFFVIFSPIKNEHYESWAYLEVKGRCDRLPLNLRGVGKGPNVIFNVKVLNINDIFLCAPHYYEVAVKNEGNIPATVIFKENITDFGGTITCDRKKVYLQQMDSCGAFVINFYSKIQGKFIERIEFIIKESRELIHLIITGNVVCPMLKLNIQEIDFGVAPFGFVLKKNFLLTNESQVPIDFYLKINGNNEMSENSDDECSEIQFYPKQGNVNAYSDQTVEVHLTTMEVKTFSEHLNVNMWGSKAYSVSIPIKYHCMCPKLICVPAEVQIKFCFLNYECKRNIKLVNESVVPGYITYTPINTSEDNSDILCSLNKKEFMIAPHEEQHIELRIITTTLGPHKFPLMFTLAGSRPMELCTILCNGQGPVVSYKPDELKFGHILLLHNTTKDLTLINDSPIPASVKITTPPQSKFQVDIHEVEIAAEDELNVPVNAYLKDNGKYTGIIDVKIDHGEHLSINVFGEGVGYSIQCEPMLKPEYNANTLLTYQEFVLPVVFTNMGKKLYKIRWSRNKTIKTLKAAKGGEIESHFSIVPDYFEISLNESKTFEIHGFSKEPEIVEEDFYCHAVIGTASKIEVIMSFIMKAEFIEPVVEISEPNLDVMLATDCTILEDEISIHNQTDVPLEINFETSSDYYLVTNDNQDASHVYQQIESKGRFTTKIRYAPHLDEKRYFKSAGEFTVHYSNHPNEVKMALSTVVCFPTVKLVPPVYDFNCIPLNSYSYTKIIIQNITFMPVKYKWEFIEEFFELEELEKIENETCCFSSNTNSTSESMLSIESNEANDEQAEAEPGTNNTEINIDQDTKQLDFTWNKEQYVSEMKKILLPIFENFVEGANDIDNDMIKILKNNRKSNQYKIHDILTIEPFEGYLEPYEYGVALVGFFPPPNMKVKAEALCKVEDGEQETLVIKGISSKISYLINKKYVEFGRQVFCEICQEEIILTNNGHCDFKFSIACDAVRENKKLLEPGWVNVSPNTMLLPLGDTVILKLKYFPGIAGEFEREFFIEIGYLEPLKIKFHGYAVFSQILLTLPRPIIQEEPIDVLYKSLSTLSVAYLHSLEQINNVNIPTYHRVPGHPPDISKIVYKQLKKDGWVIISKNDVYPSKMEMDLSIERMLIRQHVIKNDGILWNHTFIHKIKTIPEFTTGAYILDFGFVIREKPVCYTVLLLNYGPIPTDVILLKIKNNTLEKNGFKIEYKNRKLDVGEITELYVIFTPKVKRYPDLDANVEDSFYLIARHGANIPVMIKATVTIPRLIFKNPCIDFGAIKLGNCLRRSILMTNDGNVLSKWTAEIQMVESRKKIVYYLKPSEGELQPRKKQLIDIYFLPISKGFKPAKLIINIEGNEESCVLNICGNCIISTLVFNHTDLKFNSSLPYSQDNIILKMQNVSTTPLEFCFAGFDQEYEEEKLWIETYLKFHNLKRVFIPQRIAGDKLHYVFQDNYLTCLNELRLKLIQVHMSDADETETIEDPLVEFSQQEVIQLLNEYIEVGLVGNDMAETTNVCGKEDNFFLNTAVIEPEKDIWPDPRGPQNALFLIFHGAQNTEYFKAANKAGIILSLPVYSIDRLIYESLVDNNTKSANEINDMINKVFDAVALEEDLIPVPGEDEYDILCRKVYAVLHNKPRKPAKKGGGSDKKSDKQSDKKSDKKSKASDKSSEKKGKKEKITDTIIDIPSELFSDILKIKLYTFTHGLIIESLSSDFLRKNIIALDCLLHGIGNAKYVHLVILSYNLYDYIRDEEEKIKYEETQKQILLDRLNEEKAAKEEKAVKEGKTVKGQAGKTARSSTPKTSKSSKTDKSSKSKKQKAPNYTKQILKSMPKPLKLEFDAFQALVNEIYHICEFWDKRNCCLTKPYGTKPSSTSKSKTEIKNSGKDSLKDSKVSTKKRKSLETQQSSLNEIGLSLWLMSNSNQVRPIEFSEIICQSLKASWELQKAKKDIEDNMEEHLEESSTGFSIIKKLKKVDKVASDLFIISNCETVEKQNDNDIYAISASASYEKKSSGKGKSNADQTSVSLLEGEKEVTFVFTPRCILQPEDIVQYRFGFYPKKCGIYNCSFEVDILGFNTAYPVKCHGICELPQIDFSPEIVFPKILENYRNKSVYDNFVYIKDEGLFDFGIIILSNEMPLIYDSNLLLKNISHMSCEVTASLSDDSQYFLKSDTLTIEPGHEEYLTVSIRVTKTECIYSDLYISIKNNPKAEMIKLVTSSCKLEFKVDPKIIIFDKVPLNYTAKKYITLTNSSPINLWWKFVNVDWAIEIYTISEIENFLGPFSMCDVFFEYRTMQEEIHPKKNLELQVFDLNHSKEIPVYTDIITVQADSVTYNVEYKDHIDMGEIQGRKEHTITFTLLNKGNCPICVVVSEIDNPLDKDRHIRKCFQLQSQRDIVLLPNKLYSGTILFSPNRTMDLKQFPILLCFFVEPNNKENIISTFALKVSAVVLLSSFEVCPTSDIYFGYQQILSPKKQTMDIANTGKFTFNYSIVSLKQEMEQKLKQQKAKEGKNKDKTSSKSSKGKGSSKSKDKASSKKSKDKSTEKKSKSSKKSDKKSKKTKGGKPEKKKIKITKLNVEGFSIVSSTGEVEPNATAQIQIECTPREEKEYKEVIIVYVSEPQKKDLCGRRVTLHATGSEPHLNFDDFSKIFKEQFVVDKMENFIKPKNIGSHCLFVSSEITLHFNNACINTTNVTKIYLENTGHVKALVTAIIADTNGDVFTVSPNRIDIPPYSTEAISITFKPNLIEEFENKLEITYNSSKNNKFRLLLNGEGLIPQTMLLEPKMVENNQCFIDFIPTYVGHTRSKKICIRNSGLIFSKVILEICENTDEMFSLVAYDDTFDLLNIRDLEDFQNTKYSTLVNLQPNQCANFNLIFKPTSEQCLTVDIKIHTVNNPFEIIKLIVSAQSYYHDICLEELVPCNQKIMISSSFKLSNNWIGYHIDFGFSILNVLQKKYFTIKNNSESDIFKFEFTTVGQLAMVPRMGHLKSFTSKDIIVTFSTRTPEYFNRVMVQCNLNKIQYVNEELEELSWDDRQKFVTWESLSAKPSEDTLSVIDTTDETDGVSESGNLCKEKVFEEKCKKIDDRAEPEIILVPETNDMIPIFFTIIADYSSYVCKIHNLDFPDICIMEKNEVSFDVENNGLIPLEISWDFSNNEIVQTRAMSAINTCNKDCSTDSENSTVRSTASSTTLFSSDCSCLCPDDVFPFTIFPKKVSIYPNKCQQFSVYFAPINLSQYCVRLKSNISGLDPKLKNMNIKVTGTSILPVCYFDIEESDYPNKRPKMIQNTLSNDCVNLKVIEFESVGVGVSSKRRFNLINPRSEIISYKFEPVEDQRFSYFDCQTKSGFVAEEKQTEIAFTFKPQEFGNFQEYYMFYILEKNFSMQFLLIGNCRQPTVYFTRSFVIIQPTILMTEVTATAILRNDEDIELSFKFVKESLFSENHDQQLDVLPMCGKIDPNTDLNIRLTYLAQKTGEVNFYLKCVIEKQIVPLCLNVTASCLEVLSSISYTDQEGKTSLLERDKENIIDFGNVIPKQREAIQFTISNIGETGFFYSWYLNKKPVEHLFDISLNSVKDFVPSNYESNVTMSLEALKSGTLRQLKVKINISYGPTYILRINASAEKPLYNFSFKDYNFGYCIVQKKRTDYYSVGLELSNYGKKLLTLENCYENSEDLTVGFKSSQVPPLSSIHIPIFFHPLEVGNYKIEIPLTINSAKSLIIIYGEAVSVNLQPVEVSDRFIDLGGVMVGSLKRYVVQVINYTPTQVNVFFDLWERLPIQSRPREKIESDIKVPEIPPPIKKEPKKGKQKKGKKGSAKSSKKSSKSTGKGKEKKDKKKKEKSKSSKSTGKSKDKKGGKKKKGGPPTEIEEPIPEPPKKTIADFLKILPNSCIQLEPNKKCEFVIEFSPEERLEDFSKQIFYETQDHVEPLCIVKGYCLAPEFSLSNDYLSFANIVVGCGHSLSVLLKNTGDTKGRFKWFLDREMNAFKINPGDGFIPPASELKIWISFEPKAVECLFEVKAKCAIEGVIKPLELRLLGNSVKIPKPTATLTFSCPVREKVVQNVNILNTTKNTWIIYPIMSTDQFCIQNEITIRPESEYSLEIGYCPKQMTTLDNHKAVLFLPLPEGQAMLYELIGTTLPPLPIMRIQIEIHCKTDHTELLPIENWLNVEQCFGVKTELTSPITTKSLYKIIGNDLIELLPNDSKLYKWGIYVINEIPLDFKVIFTNTETNEYMFYEISLKVIPSGPLETIDLTTSVRELTKTTIKLQNPIDFPVIFSLESSISVPDLTFEKSIPLDPYSTHDLDIQYCPLKSEVIKVNIAAKCAELGTFIYCLNLVANPPKTENVIKFKAELGERASRSMFFENTFKSTFEFSAKVDHPDFSFEKSGPIPVGETSRITFNFEPYDLGILQSTVVLTSTTTGDYIYPLIGECVRPKPKGPFLVKAGSSTSINFINPFMEQKAFNYALDSNEFFLKALSEIIKPKKSTKIIVNMQPATSLQKYSVTAKLIVTCEDSGLDDIQWVYYIQGDI